MHKNTEIRNEIVSIIDTAAFGVTVYNSRSITVSKSKLPAITVFTLDEDAEETPDQTGYIRKVDVKMVIYNSGKDVSELNSGEISIEEEIDNIQEQIEALFLTVRQNLNAKVYRLFYLGSTEMKETENIEATILVRQMSFVAEYHFKQL